MNRRKSIMADKERILDSDLKNLKKDFEKLRADLSHLAANAYEHGKSEFSHATENLYNNGKKKYDSLESKLAEKPMITLVSALGVGFLLGYLGQRKNSKKE